MLFVRCFTLQSLWAEQRLTSDRTLASILDSQNKYARMAKTALSKANFADNGFIFPAMQ